MKFSLGKFDSLYQGISGATAPVTLPIYPTPNPSEASQQLKVSGTVAQFTDFTDLNTVYVFISFADNDVLLLWDDTISSDKGHYIYEGNYGLWPVKSVNEARFISVTGTATICASPMKFGDW